MCPADRAIKKKTVDEIIACLIFLPVFENIKPSESVIKEAVKAPQPVAAEPLPKPPPATLPAGTDRRSRYMHKENLSTPSISGMLSENHLAGVSEPSGAGKDKSAIREQDFDLAQLTKAWKDFAETVEAAQLKSALSVREPILKDHFVISYSLDNEVQSTRIVSDVKPRLLAFLHKVLHNERITVEFIVTENKQEILNKPFTNQEKFNTLASKYPLLNLMKQRFGLEFE
jgi:DNA polymerase-3 subunit gamma/tau